MRIRSVVLLLVLFTVPVAVIRPAEGTTRAARTTGKTALRSDAPLSGRASDAECGPRQDRILGCWFRIHSPGRTRPNLPTKHRNERSAVYAVVESAFHEARRAEQSKSDPHARCLPPGGPRQFHTPYGLLIYEIPEARRLLILSGGGPHMWRIVYMDGRPHPSADLLDNGFLGHSIGHWEGDTLVIDSVGFNEKFWMARARAASHTDALHLIERISRPDYNTLKYEVTVDDPKAYTKPWSGGLEPFPVARR